ncbi:DUF4913 domain-containing protein [Yinghuangia sp. YIM S09857]|uniref:DUF4913 domain-containing protein n=1 Tax=Yinghuangia sp. YIM S09857 TaxID=3436929 RepID=UPI003F539C5F
MKEADDGRSPLFRFGDVDPSSHEYDEHDEAEEFAEDPGHEEPESVLVFTSLESFVTEYLTQVLQRRLNRATAVWCPSWWDHPEALVRLNAMWRAFEHLRLDPTLGMSVWWLHHADPHLRVLMDPQFGPFAVCDPREGHTDRPLSSLPFNPVPPGLLDGPAFKLMPEDLPTNALQEEIPEFEEPFDAGPWASVGKPKDFGQNHGF